MSMLEDAVKEFESRFFSVADGPAKSKDAFGNIYVNIALGVKEEGEYTPYLATTEKLAVQAWLDAATKYSNENPGSILFWRTRPEISCQYFRECKENGDTVPLPSDLLPLWMIYSRFSIATGNPK